MSLDGYVRHLRQKYSIAVAIAVIKTKPPNQTIEQYLEVLKNKIKPKDKMDEDEFNISLCSEDFAMDDETSDELTQTYAALTQTLQSRAESPTLLGDFNFDVAINQQRLDKADSLEEALEVLKEIDKGPLAPQPSTTQHQQPDYFHQVPENCTEISIPNCYRTNIKKTQHSIDTHMNTDPSTCYNFEKYVEIGKDMNETLISADKHTNQQINSSFGDMDIERNCVEVDTQSTFVDIQRCFLDTQETYMETQETELNTQELQLNSQVAHDDMKNTEQYDFSQQLTHVSQSQIEDSRFKLLEMYIIGGNKTVKPPPNRNKIIPKAVEISQFMAKNDSDKNFASQDMRGDPKNCDADSNTRDLNVLSERLDNTEEPKSNSVNKIVKNNKLLDITNTVNTANDITMTAEEEVTGNSKITENSCKTMPKRAKIDDDTTVTQDITSINSEEKSQSITQTENVIPFKIIEELNRVKTLMSRRNERRLSTDGYSTDSGFVSDSQIKSSLKTSLHCSDSGLNQSAHCLFNYLMTCQYNGNNLEIATEISDVLSELVDSLHTDEVYPPFLDEVLDKIKTLLDDVSENKSENVDSIENPDNITQKDETIHRLLLLNKSINIITYTIDQITIILEKFHTNVTSTENLYEITNLEQTENLCYIFHILDILLQRYDRKNQLFCSQSSSQNSQDKIFKRNSITDIWKKKWNPDFRKKDVVDSPFRNRGLNSKISDVLNKIVVDCMDGYSLVSYAALQCFNLLQS
ncbi:uncharacterized protein LOC119693278 isoform X2 [Plutella xylostella]|uniref:uncharacterized protein LOC119693278 isoform X2 n=1 Tax=Plutella xylostella TaxID=51655 RepID=UPI00203269DB|nr:uncharacterized protein LOC119693278 isoform X2 [Plutella xylostella]